MVVLTAPLCSNPTSWKLCSFRCYFCVFKMFISRSLLTSLVNSCDKIEYLFHASKQVEFLSVEIKLSIRLLVATMQLGILEVNRLSNYYKVPELCDLNTLVVHFLPSRLCVFNICARISFPYSICPSVWKLRESAKFLLVIINIIIQES